MTPLSRFSGVYVFILFGLDSGPLTTYSKSYRWLTVFWIRVWYIVLIHNVQSKLWSSQMFTFTSSSLHSNWHQQINFDKFNEKVYYLPPYEKITWHYNRAKSNRIARAFQRRFQNSVKYPCQSWSVLRH